MDGVRETLCASCSHREVCKLKEDYLDVVKAVNEAYVSKETGDGKMGVKRVRDFDFIELQDPKCKHYIKNIPNPRELRFDGPDFSGMRMKEVGENGRVL